jgi:hypothetical protein
VSVPQPALRHLPCVWPGEAATSASNAAATLASRYRDIAGNQWTIVGSGSSWVSG